MEKLFCSDHLSLSDVSIKDKDLKDLVAKHGQRWPIIGGIDSFACFI